MLMQTEQKLERPDQLQQRGDCTDAMGWCCTGLDSVFTSAGFDNWWKKAQERFKQHARSTSHRDDVMKIEQ